MTSNNSQPPAVQKDFFIRIKEESELGRILRLLSDGEYHHSKELIEAGGLPRATYFWRSAAKSFDNLDFLFNSKSPDGELLPETEWHHKLSYVDVVGRQQTVVNVQQAEFAGGGAAPQDEGEVDNLVWPTAPPIPKKDPTFKRPLSYNEVKHMVVNKGRHISMASSPSIGKDTLIEQLAHDEGRPLVTIGAEGGLRKRDLVGSLVGLNTFLVAEAIAAMINGWWLSISEVNAADADVLLLLNAAMARPFRVSILGQSYPVHPDFRLFVSYNPGLVGTKPLPQSFKDRFYSIKLRWFTENQLRERLEAHGLPHEFETNGEPSWAQYIVWFGMNMAKAHDEGKLRYQVTTRRLVDASELMKDEIKTDVRQALRSAVIGAIDSPVEEKAAERVLEETMQMGRSALYDNMGQPKYSNSDAVRAAEYGVKAEQELRELSWKG